MSKEFDYTKLKHVTSVDQSDREVPYNLRQSGPTKVEMLISNKGKKITLLAFITAGWLLESNCLQSYLSSERLRKT